MSVFVSMVCDLEKSTRVHKREREGEREKDRERRECVCVCARARKSVCFNVRERENLHLVIVPSQYPISCEETYIYILTRLSSNPNDGKENPLLGGC